MEADQLRKEMTKMQQQRRAGAASDASGLNASTTQKSNKD
jgi:hypothetical protein